MERLLIVSNSKNIISDVLELLYHDSFSEVVTLDNCGEARRLLLDHSFDLCIINTPLSDEFGESLALDIVSDSITQVILIVKGELFEMVAEKAEINGIFTVARPIDQLNFWSVLRITNAVYHRLLNLKTENKRLMQSIEDMRLIDRAKCILIEYLNMSEEEAHKYIEKQAMDMRITKRVVSERILKTYDI
ncbi:MAG: ANTAR domain-containing protein [Anaerovorax sp.]|nr:ANTAR domain-containing protein [Anaerovorax sp.]